MIKPGNVGVEFLPQTILVEWLQTNRAVDRITVRVNNGDGAIETGAQPLVRLAFDARGKAAEIITNERLWPQRLEIHFAVAQCGRQHERKAGDGLEIVTRCNLGRARSANNRERPRRNRAAYCGNCGSVP